MSRVDADGAQECPRPRATVEKTTEPLLSMAVGLPDRMRISIPEGSGTIAEKKQPHRFAIWLSGLPDKKEETEC